MQLIKHFFLDDINILLYIFLLFYIENNVELGNCLSNLMNNLEHGTIFV